MANTQGDPIRVQLDDDLPSSESRPVATESASDATHADPTDRLPAVEGVSPSPESTPPDESKSLIARFWGWPLFWFLVLVGFSSTAMGAVVWLFSMPPVPDCKSVSNLAPDRERLYCAQQAAEAGEIRELENAIALVERWGDDHPLHRQSLKLMEQWSRTLLDRAEREVTQGNLDVALGLIQRIPPASPVYPEAQATVETWDSGWEGGKNVYDRARDALKKQNWMEAEFQAQRLSQVGDDYWSEQRLDRLMTRIAAEKEGRRKLQQAREQVTWETPQEYQSALELIGTIEADTFAREDAKPDIETWSRDVLERAIAQQKEGNYREARAAARAIPGESSLYGRAREVLLIAESDVILNKRDPLETPVSQQIVTLLEAQALAETLSADSPLYALAQERLPLWEQHLRDLYQLQMASVVADIGQPVALNVAISQARAISSDRPRRIHAQTLVAYWNQEIERIADRPILRRARRLTELGTIEGYRAAIVQARQISEGRDTWDSAQQLIAESEAQIRVLEDRPILAEAETLAEEQKFAEAVELAQQIDADRPLHDEAREAIDRFREEWRQYEDRPVLDEAIEYAEDGKLTDAIATAAELGPDSPLYHEAQGKIGEWLAERDGRNRAARRQQPATTTAPATNYAPPEPSYAPPPPPQPSYAPPPATPAEKKRIN